MALYLSPDSINHLSFRVRARIAGARSQSACARRSGRLAGGRSPPSTRSPSCCCCRASSSWPRAARAHKNTPNASPLGQMTAGASPHQVVTTSGSVEVLMSGAATAQPGAAAAIVLMRSRRQPRNTAPVLMELRQGRRHLHLHLHPCRRRHLHQLGAEARRLRSA
jgi:hypothetical protein